MEPSPQPSNYFWVINNYINLNVGPNYWVWQSPVNVTTETRQQLRTDGNGYHSMLKFIAPLIVNLIQLKYQGVSQVLSNTTATSAVSTHAVATNATPFDSHPVTMLVAVLSLVFYCLVAHAASNSTASSSSLSLLSSLLSRTNYSMEQLMMISGSTALASLGYLLFPNSTQHYAFLTLCGLIGLGFVSRWAWLRLHHLVIRTPIFMSNSRRRRSHLPLHAREMYYSEGNQ